MSDEGRHISSVFSESFSGQQKVYFRRDDQENVSQICTSVSSLS